MKNKKIDKLLRAVMVLSFTVAVAMGAVLLFNVLFLRIPLPSDNYDCDDATLQTIDRFATIGVKAVPVIGNLKINNEEYSRIDHAWVVIEFSPTNRVLAFDWGMPWLDSQHYEYYKISREKLIQYVEQDFINNGIIPAEKK